MVEVENAQARFPTQVVPSPVLNALPPQVQRRVDALKNLQVDYFKVQAEFHKEVAELEHKYFARYDVLTNKRRDIVTGVYEPTDVECKYKSPNNGDLSPAAEEQRISVDDAPVAGIPSFWLTCMKNVTHDISEFVTEEDEPVLEHLTDIVVEDCVDSFKLHFHFAPNDHFSNSVLTKEFRLKIEPNDDDPLNFEGPEIVAMKGTNIEWKSEDRNVTMKLTVNKQKNRKTGETRTVSKTVPAESFFNFFAHPDWIEDREDLSHELAAAFHADVSLGSFLRERLVPRAVLYFTGEIADDDEDDDGDDYEDDADEFEGADSDADSEAAAAGFKPIQQFLNQATQGKDECRHQ